MKIVIADDNQDSADSLAVLLRFDGHNVKVCYDGLTAIQLILQWQPAVALLDIGMPGASGYQVAQEIRRKLPRADIKLVAISGWGNHVTEPRHLLPVSMSIESSSGFRGEHNPSSYYAQAVAGLMLLFSRKRFVGSYCVFTVLRRGYAGP